MNDLPRRIRALRDYYFSGANGPEYSTLGEAANALEAALAAPASAEPISELDRLRSSNEAMRKAANRLVESELAAKVRSLVAGWNGEGVPEEYRFGRHPDVLGVTLPTDCGSIYMLDEVLAEFRATLKEEDAR